MNTDKKQEETESRKAEAGRWLHPSLFFTLLFCLNPWRSVHAARVVQPRGEFLRLTDGAGEGGAAAEVVGGRLEEAVAQADEVPLGLDQAEEGDAAGPV